MVHLRYMHILLKTLFKQPQQLLRFLLFLFLICDLLSICDQRLEGTITSSLHLLALILYFVDHLDGILWYSSNYFDGVLHSMLNSTHYLNCILLDPPDDFDSIFLKAIDDSVVNDWLHNGLTSNQFDFFWFLLHAVLTQVIQSGGVFEHLV